MLSNAGIDWLTEIFRQRIHPDMLLVRDQHGCHLTIRGSDGAIEFSPPNPNFYQTGIDFGMTWWNAESENWKSPLQKPIPAIGIESLKTPLIEAAENGYRFQYDLPGAIYWSLARVEEVNPAPEKLCIHQRFPSTQSHAGRHNYLDRPLIDEWLHVLKQVCQAQWPSLPLIQRRFRKLITCDVDTPFKYPFSWTEIGKQVAKNLIRERNGSEIKTIFRMRQKARQGNYDGDFCTESVHCIMDWNEAIGNQVRFYFIPKLTDPKDGKTNLNELRLRKLLRTIHQRGHLIGTHPGYQTFRDATAFKESVDALNRVLEQEGIVQAEFGNRQHYLRWETPTTARLVEQNGLQYDTTLGYADRPGFRCGTCMEFPMFDPVTQTRIQIQQRPLILMECSVIAERYMGLGYSTETLNYMLNLLHTCKRVSGDFTLLWHNTEFRNPEDAEFYRQLIQG